jgi:hypothetical protein
MTPLKAEYIGADQLPFFIFRLQRRGGPYIPVRGTWLLDANKFDFEEWLSMTFSVHWGAELWTLGLTNAKGRPSSRVFIDCGGPAF